MDIILKDNSLPHSNLKCIISDFCKSDNNGCVYDIIVDGSIVDALFIYKTEEVVVNPVCVELFGETVRSILDEQKIIQAIMIVFTTKGYKIDFFD